MPSFAALHGQAIRWIACLTLLFLSQPAGSAEKSSGTLEVHEWGTFTEIAGSDGRALPWWTVNLSGPAELPEFVQRNLGASKSFRPFTTRMETPVIYFYPSRQMAVQVRAEYPTGLLTEWYPAPAAALAERLAPAAKSARWEIDLLPPDDKRQNAIPTVAGRGYHYAHARRVPDAWLVRNRNEPGAGQMEKFIFYRGAGDSPLPLSGVNDAEGGIEIRQRFDSNVDKAFVIRITENTMAWEKTRGLAARNGDEPATVSIRLPHSLEPIASARPALEAALVDDLTRAGLSQAEGEAMVATWREAWLGEPGLRLLYLLPRAWVDSNLLLSIDPKPSRVERVFVARCEMITPAQETALASLITNSPADDAALAAAVQKIGLGRFIAAGAERALQMQTNDWRARIARIQQVADIPSSN